MCKIPEMEIGPWSGDGASLPRENACVTVAIRGRADSFELHARDAG